MKKISKILIVLVALTLAAVAFAFAISASEEPVTYTSWEEALEYNEDGSIASLKGNLTTAESLTVSSALTIDLNGYSVTHTATSGACFVAASGADLTLRGNADFTLSGGFVYLTGDETEEGAASVFVDAFSDGITLNLAAAQNVFKYETNADFCDLAISGTVTVNPKTFGNYFITVGYACNANIDIDGARIVVNNPPAGLSLNYNHFTVVGYNTTLDINDSYVYVNRGHIIAYQKYNKNNRGGIPYGPEGNVYGFSDGFDQPSRINIYDSEIYADAYTYSKDNAGATDASGGVVSSVSNNFAYIYSENSVLQGTGRIFQGYGERPPVNDYPGRVYIKGGEVTVMQTNYGSAAVSFDGVNIVLDKCFVRSLSTIGTKNIYLPQSAHARLYIPKDGDHLIPTSCEDQGTGTLIKSGTYFRSGLTESVYYDQKYQDLSDEIKAEKADLYLTRTVDGVTYLGSTRNKVVTEVKVTDCTYDEAQGCYTVTKTTTKTTYKPFADTVVETTATATESSATEVAVGTVISSSSAYADSGCNSNYTVEPGCEYVYTFAKVWDGVALDLGTMATNDPHEAAKFTSNAGTVSNLETVVDGVLDYKYVAYYGVADDLSAEYAGYFAKSETEYSAETAVTTLTTEQKSDIFSPIENGAAGRGGVYFKEKYTDPKTGYSNVYFVYEDGGNDTVMDIKDDVGPYNAYMGVRMASNFSSAGKNMMDSKYSVTDFDISTHSENPSFSVQVITRENLTTGSTSKWTNAYSCTTFYIDRGEISADEWLHITVIIEMNEKDNGDGTYDYTGSFAHIYVDGVHRQTNSIFVGGYSNGTKPLAAVPEGYRISLDQIRIGGYAGETPDGNEAPDTILIDNLQTLYYLEGYEGVVDNIVADKNLDIRTIESDEIVYGKKYVKPTNSPKIMVDGELFSNVSDAMAFADDHSVVTLLSDISSDDPMPVDKKLMIDANGYSFAYETKTHVMMQCGDNYKFREPVASDYLNATWLDEDGNTLATTSHLIGTKIEPYDSSNIGTIEGNNGWYDLTFKAWRSENGLAPEAVANNGEKMEYTFEPAMKPVADIDGIKFNLTTYTHFALNFYIPKCELENVTVDMNYVYQGEDLNPEKSLPYSKYGSVGTIKGVDYYCFRSYPGANNTATQNYYISYKVTHDGETYDLVYHTATSIPGYALAAIKQESSDKTAKTLIAAMARYVQANVVISGSAENATLNEVLAIAEEKGYQISYADIADEIAKTEAGTAMTTLSDYISGAQFVLGMYEPRFAFKYNSKNVAFSDLLTPINAGGGACLWPSENTKYFIDVRYKNAISGASAHQLLHHYAYGADGKTVNWTEDAESYHGVTSSLGVYNVRQIMTLELYRPDGTIVRGTYSLADHIKAMDTLAANEALSEAERAEYSLGADAARALYAYSVASEAYKRSH